MNYAILLSGGTGSRAGTDIPKQYIRIGEHMMITSALKTLLECALIDEVFIISENDWREVIIEDATKMGLDTDRIKGFAVPGKVRQSSILNGMEAIIQNQGGHEGILAMSDNDTVLVHDAARPFLSDRLLSECYGAVQGHDGVMPALPMKDTVYQSIDGQRITGLLNRQEIYAGQAPELFLFKKYYEANLSLLPDRILQINGASEPAIMAGMDIVVIPGDERNIKITTAEDVRKLKK